MKIGDVVVLKGKVIEKEDRPGVLWSMSSTNDYLTLIEGKADIGGCILAKDYKGEIHCIRPDLFEVVWTQEEVVARKMMEQDVMQFKPVSAPEIEQRLLQSMARMLSKNIDDEIINGTPPGAKGGKVGDWKWEWVKGGMK